MAVGNSSRISDSIFDYVLHGTSYVLERRCLDLWIRAKEIAALSPLGIMRQHARQYRQANRDEIKHSCWMMLWKRRQSQTRGRLPLPGSHG
jgi:hypothetical protein